MTADVELPAILRDIATGRRNSVGDYWSRDYCNQAAAEIEALRAEVSGLRAARIGYASEFPPTEDGDPDVGNIHANIRAMKSRAERLAEALDNIARVGKASRNQTTRTRWIVARAVSALNGDNDWRQITKPKGYHDALERAVLRDHGKEGKE